jgi:hypothetical protein
LVVVQIYNRRKNLAKTSPINFTSGIKSKILGAITIISIIIIAQFFLTPGYPRT